MGRSVSSLGEWALWLNLASTFFMAGLIWFVQVVHYPLMSAIGTTKFAGYHALHTRWTGLVVVPPMLLEAATTIYLVWPSCPGVDRLTAFTGLVLVALIWISTFALQVPCHERLADGFDAQVHRRLVRSNWLRTVSWSARAALVLTMVAGAR